MANQSNIRQLAARLGQLPLAECEPYRNELLAVLNDGASHPFPTDIPSVGLMRALGRAAHEPARPQRLVHDLDAVAGGVTGEAPADAEERRGVLPLPAGPEASLTYRRNVVDADRHMRIGVR